MSAVYTIDPFVRSVEDILDEVVRKERRAERPVPQNKRVRADLVGDKEATFIDLAHQIQKTPDSNPKARDLSQRWGAQVEKIAGKTSASSCQHPR